METTKVIKTEVIGEYSTEYIQLDLENGDKILASKNHKIGNKNIEEYIIDNIIKM